MSSLVQFVTIYTIKQRHEPIQNDRFVPSSAHRITSLFCTRFTAGMFRDQAEIGLQKLTICLNENLKS